MRKLTIPIGVNSACLSWETARRAVSGDPEKRTGIILAKSFSS